MVRQADSEQNAEGRRLRASNLDRLVDGDFDVLIVGAGINGAVSASALSAQGARVALVDRGDFSGFTSQSSSNLVWGGIKYLESLELGLVTKLCRSRNRLMHTYPSSVREIRFFTTLERGFRLGRWLLWLGSWLYWWIGGSFTRTPRLLGREDIARDAPMVDASRSIGGVEYSDAYLVDNDARFVFGFVRAAMDRGAIAVNYVEAEQARRGADGRWEVPFRDCLGSTQGRLRARVVVNACGPMVGELNERSGVETSHRHVLSRGIHLIVDAIAPHDRVLTFFADDGRMFFVIPMGPRSCIGTTDTRQETLPPEVSAQDRQFVLDNINKRLKLDPPLSVASIIAERCGVRPLVVKGKAGVSGDADWTSLSRKHAVEVDEACSHISIFGGKLTDCLNVGEQVVEAVSRLGVALPHQGYRWYGEPPDQFRDEFFHQARLMNLDAFTAAQSSELLSTRLWRRYAAHALGLLEDIRHDPRMAEVLIEGAEYIRCELHYAARREMIVQLEDFLRRRSKIAQIASRETLRNAPGMFEACRILFGADAERQFESYFGTPPSERVRRDSLPPEPAAPESVASESAAPESAAPESAAPESAAPEPASVPATGTEH